MRALAILMLCAGVGFAVPASFGTPAEAKPKVSKNFGKNVGKGMRNVSRGVSRSVRNASRSVYNSARWGGRTIWVGTGLGAGAARASRNCNYYYRRYRDTGHAKWRNRYNACIR